jgi:hypothetical protein
VNEGMIAIAMFVLLDCFKTIFKLKRIPFRVREIKQKKIK